MVGENYISDICFGRHSGDILKFLDIPDMCGYRSYSIKYLKEITHAAQLRKQKHSYTSHFYTRTEEEFREIINRLLNVS